MVKVEVEHEDALANGRGARLAAPNGSGRIGYLEVVAAFDEISGAISEHLELDSLLHIVAQRICELVGIKRCSVYLKDERTGLFRGEVAHADRNIDAAIKGLTAGIEADGFTREILTTKRPVLIVHAQSDPRPVRSTMLEWEVHTMLGVPMARKGEVIGILFLDNEDLPHDYTEEEQTLCGIFANLSAVAISHAQLTAELRVSLETVERQNTLLRNAAAIEDRLATLVLEGASLHEVAGAVAELTGKPAMVLDSSMRPLTSVTNSSSGEAILDRLLADLREDTTLAEAIEKCEGKRPRMVDSELAAKLKNRILVAPVSVGGDVWGYLVVVEHGGWFNARDRIVARRAGTIIALEMSAERRAADAEMRAQETLTRDLIMGCDDATSLQRRANFHGVNLTAPHAVCLFSAPAARRRLKTRRVLDALAATHPESHPIVAGVEDGIAAVIELPENGSPVIAAKEIATEALEALAPDGSAVVAVSSICHTASQYPSAYREAQQVGQCIAAYCAEGTVHVLTATDLGAARLLLAGTAREEADRFAHDTLGMLLEPGLADLLTTLQVFFRSSRSVRRSAEQLGVHENTIRYRLGRVEKMTGLEVSGDADHQLTIQLALLILRLGGSLPAEPPLAGEADAPIIPAAEN